MNIVKIALATAVLAAGFSTPVQAAKYIVTVKGVVPDGSDEAGFFGERNASLNGQAFTAIYTLTFPSPGAQLRTDGVSFTFYSGGTSSGSVGPLSSTLTIKGVTQQMGGPSNSYVIRVNNGNGLDLLEYYATDLSSVSGVSRSTFLDIGIFSRSMDIINSVNLTEPLDYTVRSSDGTFGRFLIANLNTGSRALGSLKAQSITVKAMTGVPEPAAWMSMIAGFGLTGAVLRRRRTMAGVGAG